LRVAVTIPSKQPPDLAVPASRRQPPRRWWAILLGVLALLGALRVGLLLASGTGLQVDEAQYWTWSRDLHWGYYSKPPVIALLIAASTTLFGHTVLGVKALAMLCWLLVAVLVFFFTRELVRDAQAGLAKAEAAGAAAQTGRRSAAPAASAAATLAPGATDLPDRAGFWAALLFTTTPVAGLLGMAVTTDAPLLLCWTLASWLLWRALRSGRITAWLLLGLVLGVGVLSKYTLAAWLPGAAVLAWLARQNLRRVRVARLQQEGAAPAHRPRRLRCLPGLALALGVALIVCLPHLAWNAAWGWPTWHHTADITAAAHRSGDLGAAASLGEFLGGQLLLIGPVLAVWLLVLAGGWLRGLAHQAGSQGWRQGLHSVVAQASGAPLADAPVVLAASLASALAGARRHLLWLSLPLLALGAAQAINARAQMNWTAPIVPLLCIWLGLHLVSAPSAALVQRRRRIALAGMALSLGLTLFAAGAPSVAAALGHPWPARLDLYIRMRGWPEAYAQLKPQIVAHPGWRVLGVNRDVISHGAWLWRDLDIDWAAWREPGPPHDHFQLTIPYDRPRQGLRAPAGVLDGALPGDRAQLGEPLLVLSDTSLPLTLRRRLHDIELLQQVEVSTAPGRLLTLSLWSARLPELAAQRP
jgi:hypothetical protein